jgi:hypothetical protein
MLPPFTLPPRNSRHHLPGGGEHDDLLPNAGRACQRGRSPSWPQRQRRRQQQQRGRRQRCGGLCGSLCKRAIGASLGLGVAGDGCHPGNGSGCSGLALAAGPQAVAAAATRAADTAQCSRPGGGGAQQLAQRKEPQPQRSPQRQPALRGRQQRSGAARRPGAARGPLEVQVSCAAAQAGAIAQPQSTARGYAMHVLASSRRGLHPANSWPP